MKICLVHEEYPEETNFGGIATYQKIMAEELVKQGNTVYVICRGVFEDKTYVENGVNIYRLYVAKTDDQVHDYIAYRKRVAKLLSTFQEKQWIDIIETPDWGAETFYFEKDRKVPLVVRLHTPLKVWLKYNKNDFGKVTDLLLSWEDTMLKSANFITCCSNALKNIVIEDFNIDFSRILVTPNPANITNFYQNTKVKKENKIIFVGSLEERKGVIVLAKALNIVFQKYPNLKIEFVGKDTSRNSQNISTMEFILQVVNQRYHNNIRFVGQIPNSDLNIHLNKAMVGVFPSLFDNFPYVVLEAMATGLHIIGSKNSGMVEMLDDDDSIYDTGDYHDLAVKIIKKYELSLQQKWNEANIERVREQYSPIIVCSDIRNLYDSVFNEYYSKQISLEDLQYVLSTITNEKIISFSREENGVANLVFKVMTEKNIYIIKKYLHQYEFDLAKELYQKYEKNMVSYVKPLNQEIITYHGYKYNVFECMDREDTSNLNMKFLEKLVTCERQTSSKSTLKEKCDKYYLLLNKLHYFNGIQKDHVKYVISMYEKLRNLPFIQDQYLNHGDINKGNILNVKQDFYMIDFDEVTVSTYLYDFAVIVIKNFVKDQRLDYKLYTDFKKRIQKYYLQYDNADFDNIVKYYLCKILLEKFYLHVTKQINLFDSEQVRDNYIIYFNILKDLENRL